jgi:hypothetical protein
MDRIRDGETNTLAARGLKELFFQLGCLVSFWFWREIGFGLHTYVLRVPYSCGVVSVFLVLAGKSFWYVRSPYSCGVVLVFLVMAGNSFWCYVRTYCTIQLCGCVLKK